MFDIWSTRLLHVIYLKFGILNIKGEIQLEHMATASHGYLGDAVIVSNGSTRYPVCSSVWFHPEWSNFVCRETKAGLALGFTSVGFANVSSIQSPGFYEADSVDRFPSNSIEEIMSFSDVNHTCNTSQVVVVRCSYEECGKRKINSFTTSMVNGNNSQAGSWPWFGSILSNPGSRICSGTLLTHEYVVTAAHCLKTPNSIPTNHRVTFGSDNFDTTTGPTVQTRIATVTHHHEMFTLSDIRNDIGLLKVHPPIEFTQFVRPICLLHTESNISDDFQCHITGHGLSKIGESRSFSLALQEDQVEVLSNLSCNSSFESYFDDHTMLCAEAHSTNTCFGDSGGPLSCLMYGDDEPFFLVGVTSAGYCNGPGVFTRVTSYINWISKYVIGLPIYSQPMKDIGPLGSTVNITAPKQIIESVSTTFICTTAFHYPLGKVSWQIDSTPVWKGIEDRAVVLGDNRTTLESRFTHSFYTFDEGKTISCRLEWYSYESGTVISSSALIVVGPVTNKSSLPSTTTLQTTTTQDSTTATTHSLEPVSNQPTTIFTSSFATEKPPWSTTVSLTASTTLFNVDKALQRSTENSDFPWWYIIILVLIGLAFSLMMIVVIKMSDVKTRGGSERCNDVGWTSNTPPAKGTHLHNMSSVRVSSFGEKFKNSLAAEGHAASRFTKRNFFGIFGTIPDIKPSVYNIFGASTVDKYSTDGLTSTNSDTSTKDLNTSEVLKVVDIATSTDDLTSSDDFSLVNILTSIKDLTSSEDLKLDDILSSIKDLSSQEDLSSSEDVSSIIPKPI